jgi:galactonate dehydratase
LLSVADAAAFASAISPSQPLWIEDLVSPWPRDPLERLAGRLNQPLAAGRGVRPELLPDLARTMLIDHLILEVNRVGGPLESRRLAALAEMQHTGVVTSGAGGAVSLRDALQLAAVLPNLTAVEVPRGLAKIEDGMITTARSIA